MGRGAHHLPLREIAAKLRPITRKKKNDKISHEIKIKFSLISLLPKVACGGLDVHSINYSKDNWFKV